MGAAADWTFNLRPYADASRLWSEFRDGVPSVTIYHSDNWLELLRRAYGVTLWVATVQRGSEVRAGCVLAQTKNPLGRKLIALPFSDFCPPLATDNQAQTALLDWLAQNLRTCEIRGLAAQPPWQTVDRFEAWSFNLARPLAEIQAAVDSRLRRKLRRSSEAGIEISHGSNIQDVKRYYALHAETRHRLGVPTQPMRMFTLLQEIFAADGGLEIWFASHHGIDVAGVVALRYRDQLYYKWGARQPSAPPGANHQLVWTLMCAHAGHFRFMDLGRTDIENPGLIQFKKEIGARPSPLPYTFFPKAPRQVSAERMTGWRGALSGVWRHLPGAVARNLGGLLYPYLG